MIIKRNGMEIELTAEELRKAYDEYELQCYIEDVISVLEQDEDDDYFSEEDLHNTETMCAIAKRISYALSLQDGYWEEYWCAVGVAIEEYIKKHPREM